MARLVWGAVGERYYETGVDRGVLYVGDQPGVAWTGLTSMSETLVGGEARPFYVEGEKVLNLAAAEEFEATINAFASPTEFGPCEGIARIHKGLHVSQQARKQFGFSYRTKVGNDLEGVDHAYKVHLIYNALAAPTERANTTTGADVSPTQFSWAITTLPPIMTGFKVPAYFVLDSRKIPSDVLTSLEDILYGNVSLQPRLPSVEELTELLAEA